jgi:hypothetical protein
MVSKFYQSTQYTSQKICVFKKSKLARVIKLGFEINPGTMPQYLIIAVPAVAAVHVDSSKERISLLKSTVENRTLTIVVVFAMLQRVI